MEATDVLMSEHRVIERVLTALETGTSRLEAGNPVRPGFFLDASDFIKGFADGCHHAKEEGVLFKAMEAAGMPSEGGPIGVMLVEHDQGREHTRGMVSAAERLQQGDGAAVGQLITDAAGYAALLRQHIQKEDQILYPMADQVIPAEGHAQVLRDCRAAEESAGGDANHAHYLALADQLVAQAAG